MNTILVPTDHSDCANNALQYSIEMAMFSNAKLVLLHVYPIPISTGELPMMLISSQELEEENSVGIKKLEDKILKQVSGKIQVESIARVGFAMDEILDIVKEKKIDMLVMGMKGADKPKEVLIGSNVISLIKKASCPVIVVPEKAKFQQIKKIVYACDYEKAKYHHSALEPLWEFAYTHGAEIMIFNVKDSRVHSSTKEAIEGISLEHWHKRVKHSYWFAESSDIVEAINDFVKNNNAVMIAMLGHKHPFPENLIHKSTTKNMAFHSHTPILSLHE